MSAMVAAAFWTDAKWSVLITGIVGVIGVLATAITAWLGRRSTKELAAQQHAHDQAMARQRLDHERAMAMDERFQRRREALYADALTEMRMANSEVVRALVHGDGEVAMLSDRGLEALTAQLHVQGSAEALEIFKTWRSAYHDAENAYKAEKAAAEGGQHRSDWDARAEGRRALGPTAMQALDGSMRLFAEQAKSELSGTYKAPEEPTEG
jgi:hypothetical protein